jgi:hypothetical protein
VVKLVDTPDLKSVASVTGACRFDFGPGHQYPCGFQGIHCFGAAFFLLIALHTRCTKNRVNIQFVQHTTQPKAVAQCRKRANIPYIFWKGKPPFFSVLQVLFGMFATKHTADGNDKQRNVKSWQLQNRRQLTSF